MSKRLRSKRRSSLCIFQVVALLSIRSFPPEFLVVFNSISVVKSIKFSTNSKYFVYIFQQLPSMRRTHVGNPTWINSISPELCPPLTRERARSGNEIDLWQAIVALRWPRVRRALGTRMAPNLRTGILWVRDWHLTKLFPTTRFRVCARFWFPWRRRAKRASPH
jgi:hypothetical protein